MNEQRKMESKVPSLVDLCVRIAIDNVRYLGDVGETDLHLLERILRHCSEDQLMHVEKNSVGRDLSPITDELWKGFYEKRFGKRSINLVIERMREKKVAFRWLQLYEAKLKDMGEAEQKSADRLKQLYEKTNERKRSRQVQICTKVPPAKKSFWGGSGSSYNVSHLKSNLMQKSRLDFLKSREVAMRKKTVQRTPSASTQMIKPSGYSGKSSGSLSTHIKPFRRS
jgi:elongin-A